MGKGKRIQAVDGQLQLPKEIIQHIQSFLSGKQAASTAVICKSWYHSWLTRPSLDFDERYFQNQNSDSQSDEKFMNFVKRSMERYHEFNLNIESFRLWMNVRDIDSYSLATELIVKAVKIGANCIDVEFHPPVAEYLLPKELFEAESLIGLSVVGCRIFSEEIMCSRLKSLRLCKVSIEEDMISDIILKCPLIENLFLSDCEGLLKVDLSKMVKLESFSFIRHVDTPMALRKPLIEFEDQSVGSVTNDRIIVSEFRNLSCLLLERVKINKMLFCDFSKNFPCVEDLTVSHCSGCLRFDVSSNSLKYITLANSRKLEVQLDVPNIRKFKFSGPIIPSLSIITASSEWESHLAFLCWNLYLGSSWFLQLKNFLTNLNPSKIFLSIELFRSQGITFVPNIQDFAKPIVEDLILKVHSLTSVCPSLLDVIFWSFRPKLITLFLFPTSNGCGKASNETLLSLCKRLMGQENRNLCNSTDKMIGWLDLEGVKAEVFKDTLMEWKPLPWQALYLLDALGSAGKELCIRFQLR